MFAGEFEHTMDDKGRVSLPIRHREALGDVVMIGRGTRGQVNVLPLLLWKNMAERAQQASQDRGDIDDTVRFLFSYNETDLDRQGRIVVPGALRRHADLGADVTILGNGNRVEIWNREQWQAGCARVVVAKQTQTYARPAVSGDRRAELAARRHLH
jgi:MraZ protein